MLCLDCYVVYIVVCIGIVNMAGGYISSSIKEDYVRL